MKNFILTFFCLSFAFTAMAQTVVTGNVVDNKGETVIGATVLEEGTTNGTITDIDGNFSLTVGSPNATLNISSFSYQTQNVALNGRTTIKVTLSDETILQEVVAIGYGSQKKKEVTGAVSSLKAEEFNAGAKTNPLGLLQGRIAGVNIQRTAGGDPTQTGFNVQIRGFSTLDKGTGSSPLYIVDGVPVNNIDNISPDEIASMDVLKDGSAAAIYGTRGTNGVILITTKRGATQGSECSKTMVEYSGYVSFSTRIKHTGMATPEQFRNLSEISGGKVNPTLEPKDVDDNVIGWLGDGKQYNTDWLQEMTRKFALIHNHNFAISGAAKNLSYRGSISFKNAQGIARNSNRMEFIAKLAADQKALNDWLNIQYDMSYMHYRNDYFCGDFKLASIVNPSYPVYDPTTETGYFYIQASGQANPVEAMNLKESYQDGDYFRGSIRPSINIKPVEGLKVSAFLAFEAGNNWNYWYNQHLNYGGVNMAGRKPSRNMNKLFETTIDYANNFGAHAITAVAGFSYQNFEYDGCELSNGGFITDAIKYYSIGDGQAAEGDDLNPKMNISSYRNSHTLAALFARVNYTYAEKYLLSVSVRREGSSRFGANNKWGWFPAASVGWRMNKEKFLKDSKFVNELKPRFGFGVTGNNLNSDLQSLSLLVNGGTFWYNNQWVYTYTVGRNANPDLRWEKKFEYNLGLDFSFWNNRLYGTIDAYLRNTVDLLWDYNVPTPPYQFPTLLANAGKIFSRGLEFSINVVPVKTKDFVWTTTPTIAFNHSKVTKISDPSKNFNYDATPSATIGENTMQNFNTQLLKEGESIGNFYGYEFVKFNSEGKAIYRTAAGGISSEPTEADMKVIGNAQPLFIFGWHNTFKYKNFDLSFFFRGNYGNKLLNVTRIAYGPDISGAQSMNLFMKDVYDGVFVDKQKFSSYFLEDGSYIKLDNVTLGYMLPIKANKYVSNCRFYFTAQNVFTLTNYSGVDPEVNTTSVRDAGVDWTGFYPNVRNFMLGINITFN